MMHAPARLLLVAVLGSAAHVAHAGMAQEFSPDFDCEPDSPYWRNKLLSTLCQIVDDTTPQLAPAREPLLLPVGPPQSPAVVVPNSHLAGPPQSPAAAVPRFFDAKEAGAADAAGGKAGGEKKTRRGSGGAAGR